MAASYLKTTARFLSVLFLPFYSQQADNNPAAQMLGRAFLLYPGVKNMTLSACLIRSL